MVMGFLPVLVFFLYYDRILNYFTLIVGLFLVIKREGSIS